MKTAIKPILGAFVATCRTVKGPRDGRVGVLAACCTALDPIRSSDKLMENHGIPVSSNLPKHFSADFRMDYGEIIAVVVGRQNAFKAGRVEGWADDDLQYFHR